MAIGQRIKFFRNRKGFTQKQLGEMLGFHGKSSDVRMAQYESEARIPKQELIKEMADRLEVDTKALTVPNIDNYLGLMHIGSSSTNRTYWLMIEKAVCSAS